MADENFDYWYKWYPTRIRRKTMHLCPYQDGIYRRLIDEYMLTREALPDNDQALARIVGISLEHFTPHSKEIRKFFKAKKGTLINTTCEEVLEEQEIGSEKRKNRAKKGGEAKAKKAKENNGNSASSKNQAEVKQPKTPQKPARVEESRVEESRVEESREDKEHSSSSEPVVPKTHTEQKPKDEERACAFSEFWEARPGRGKDADPREPAAEAFNQLLDAGEDPAKLIAAMRRYAATAKGNEVAGTRYAKSAARFLTEGHWNQYATEAPAEPGAMPHNPIPLPDWLKPMTKFHDPNRLRTWFRDISFIDGKITAPSKFIADRIRQEFAQGLSHCFKGAEIVISAKGGNDD